MMTTEIARGRTRSFLSSAGVRIFSQVPGFKVIEPQAKELKHAMAKPYAHPSHSSERAAGPQIPQIHGMNGAAWYEQPLSMM